MEDIIENRVFTNGNVKLVYAQYFKDTSSLLKEDNANSITVVLNSGLHGYSVKTEVLEVILDMIQRTTGSAKAELRNANLLIWKTTTPSQMGVPAPNVTFPHTWEGSRHSQVFDTAGIIDAHFADKARADLYWDNLHFIGDVYHAFNSELIAFIEDAKKGLI
ncbi:hypothetical protein HDU89_003688 [Geranomyces variabilis]|nr:hypothetical protein HDU89_003688 [Geranomyces variabilis]